MTRTIAGILLLLMMPLVGCGGGKEDIEPETGATVEDRSGDTIIPASMAVEIVDTTDEADEEEEDRDTTTATTASPKVDSSKKPTPPTEGSDPPTAQLCDMSESDAMTLGAEIYAGKGACVNCHGGDGSGSVLGPDLTDDAWTHISGDVASIKKNIRTGVSMPVDYPTPMPAMGGGSLSERELCALAHYVARLSK